jgi:PfaB family protein
MAIFSVIGLDARFADASGIDRFERMIYAGLPHAGQALEGGENPAVLCQHSAEAVIRQAALSAADVALVLVASNLPEKVVVHLGKQFEWLEVVASTGDALVMAEQLLAKKQAVVLMGVGLQVSAGQERATLSFAAGFGGYGQSPGIATLLLARPAWVANNGSYRYADILSYAVDSDVAIACHKALDDAVINREDVKFVEVTASADQAQMLAEAAGLAKAYRSEKRLQTAITGIRSVTGDGGGFTQVGSLLKTVLALHQRYFPGIQGWESPQEALWQQSPFYFPTESRTVFPDPQGKPLLASVSCMSDSGYCHLVISENAAEPERSNGFIACSDLVLIPVAANTANQLFTALDKLEKAAGKKPLRQLATAHYESFLAAKGKLRLCLLAESAEELLREIAMAREGIPAAIESAQEWKTPKGSFFTPVPVGNEDDVAFLYPGIGATYVGLGRDIFHLFPEIYQKVARLADNIGASLKEEILNPRSINRLGFAEVKALDHELRNSLPNIAECGVGFACVFTKIFEEVLKVRASFSTGYSMGEISMYAALGCWQQPGLMSRRLGASETFNHRLTGELQTLRHHWDLPPAKEGEIQQLWETYTLKATPEAVAEASMDEDRVYCTIINTPDSLVIGGYPEACQRVIKKLGVRAMPLDMPNAIHSEPAFKEYEQMEQLFTMEVAERISTRMFSSSCYLPVPQRSKAIANSIAKCLCDPVDFPRLINTMYDKGARVFIEMGPGRSLCSWIDKILKHGEEKPHVSVPVNAKGTSDELTILRAIAKLVSHGVKVDMTKLYYGSLLHGAEKK